MLISRVGKCLLMAVAVIAIHQSISHAQSGTKSEKIALDGNCAVCLVDAGHVVKGDSHFSSTYDGYSYLFPSAKVKQVFDQNPEKYAPVLNGDCAVCLVKANARNAGNTKHFVKYNGRIYLFPAEDQKAMFEKNPAEFADVDLALEGNCAVCLSMGAKEAPGSTDYTSRFHGYRYLFPSDKERQVFLKSPDKFVLSSHGETDCAACTFKVRPIGSPDQLGLAIKVNESRILIIEDAHKLYSDVYNKRFDHLSVSVEGTPIKTEGKYTWIKPTFLSVSMAK